MLLITAQRMMPSSENDATYTVLVRITRSATQLETLWKGTLSGHNRKDGWKALLSQIAERVSE